MLPTLSTTIPTLLSHTHACLLLENGCSVRGVWVVLCCAGVWLGAPCSMAAERCGCLHVATSPCGGWSSLECSLQSIAPIQKCFLLCSVFLVVLDRFRALSLAYWYSIVFACVVDIGRLSGVGAWVGKDSGKAWLPCNQITALLIVFDYMVD